MLDTEIIVGCLNETFTIGVFRQCPLNVVHLFSCMLDSLSIKRNENPNNLPRRCWRRPLDRQYPSDDSIYVAIHIAIFCFKCHFY